VTLRPLLLVAALLMTAPAAIAQKTPQETLDRFVALANAGELTTPEGQALLTGEAKQMATSAKSALPAVDRVIPIGNDKAAARFVLRSPSGEEADVYFYLEKAPQGWAVAAYRAVAMSAIDATLLGELKKRRQLTEAEQIEKRNLELALSTDGKLRAWFAANRAALEGLVKSPTDVATTVRAREIGLRNVSTVDGKTEVVVGHAVGFLHPGPSGPPQIDPSGSIWVEDLGGGWFLHRRG
jgi:hypothetical protein